MCIEKFCRREVVTAQPEMSVANAARVMREAHVGNVVVVSTTATGRRPVGIVTDRDIVIEVVAAGLDPAFVKLADLLLERVITAEAGDGYLDTVKTMAKHGVRRLPVVDERGDLVGIVTLDDLLAQLAAPLADLATIAPRERRRESVMRP